MKKMVFLLLILMFSFKGFADPVTTTLYYRSDTHDINGITGAYQLKPSNTTTSSYFGYSWDMPFSGYYKLDIAIRHSDGSETILGSTIGEHTLNSTQLLVTDDVFNCPETYLSYSDAIKITEYVQGLSMETRIFITEQASQIPMRKLNTAQWHFRRYLEYIHTGSCGTGCYIYFNSAWFHHGDSANASRIENISCDNDVAPPTPNPATMQSATANSSSEIIWTATSGIDPLGVMYNFNGSFSSGWQSSSIYTRSSLSENTSYYLNVQMRDGLGNIGTASADSYRYTLLNPPTDGELNIVANNASQITISVVSPPNAGSGQTGCKITNITGIGQGGSSSSALTGTYSFVDTGLQPNTLYGYKVKYKNGDGTWTVYNTTEQQKYTLPALPNLVCNKFVNTPFNDPNFTFTNKNLYGAGEVNYYRYIWTQSSNYSFIGFESI